MGVGASSTSGCETVFFLFLIMSCNGKLWNSAKKFELQIFSKT